MRRSWFLSLGLLFACVTEPEPGAIVGADLVATRVGDRTNAGYLHNSFLRHFDHALRSRVIRFKDVSLDEQLRTTIETCKAHFTRMGVEYPCDVDFDLLFARIDALYGRSDRASGVYEMNMSPQRLDYYYSELEDLTGQYPDLSSSEYAAEVTALQNAAFSDPELDETESVQFYDSGEVAKDSYAYWPQQSSLEPYYDPYVGEVPFGYWLGCMLAPEHVISTVGGDVLGSGAGSVGLVLSFAAICAISG